MGLLLTTAPALEPLTLTEAKAHLRQDGTDEDALIVALISSVRIAVENYLSRALINQTWTQTFPSWGCLELLRPPHVSVTSVSYLDANGDSQTLASSAYQVDLSGDMQARVMPAYGTTFPVLRSQVYNPVTIVFVAGYGATAASVPGPIRSAMLLLLAHLYSQREAVSMAGVSMSEAPLSVQWLLGPYRVYYA